MSDLGRTLRAWRERIDPAAAGLVRGTSRRTPGLRREELAVLAGISIEYVVRLEQGRATTPSAQVCAALGRALQLSDDEQTHLLRMSGHGVGRDRVPRLVSASVRRILDRLSEQPLAVYDATWQLLHWNALFAATFGDPTAMPAAHANLLIRQFEDIEDRLVFTPEERHTFRASLVADLRVASSRYPGDTDLAALVVRLRRIPVFEEIWATGAVAEHRSGHKTVRHPEVGDLELDSDVLTTSDSDLRVIVYTAAPGSRAHGRLELLAAIGMQTIVEPQR